MVTLNLATSFLSAEWRPQSQVSTLNHMSGSISLIEVALTLYEYAITFDQEVQAVWRRTCTVSSLLLLSIRWVMVLSAIMSLVSLLPRVSAPY